MMAIIQFILQDAESNARKQSFILVGDPSQLRFTVINSSQVRFTNCASIKCMAVPKRYEPWRENNTHVHAKHSMGNTASQMATDCFVVEF